MSETTNIDQEKQAATETAVDSEEPAYPSFAATVIIILGLSLAVFLVALDQTIIGVAIPEITNQFKSIEDIAWYGSAYFLTSTALQPSYGRLYKIFSVRLAYRLCGLGEPYANIQFDQVKWSFLAAIAFFEIGSLICAVGPSSTVLIVGRATAGTGVAGIFSGAMVIIALTGMLVRVVSGLDLMGLTVSSTFAQATARFWHVRHSLGRSLNRWPSTRGCIYRRYLVEMVLLYQVSSYFRAHESIC